MVLEGRNAYYGTGSDCNNILDTFTGEYRPFAEADMIDAIRLCDALKHVDFVMSMGLLRCAKPEHQYQIQYAAMLKYSKKPQVIIAADGPCLDDIVEIAASVYGGREALKVKPRFVLYDEPTSPLVHSAEAMEKLIYAAENLVPQTMARYDGGCHGSGYPRRRHRTRDGGSAVRLVLHQTVNPGAPFVFGAGMSNSTSQHAAVLRIARGDDDAGGHLPTRQGPLPFARPGALPAAARRKPRIRRPLTRPPPTFWVAGLPAATSTMTSGIWSTCSPTRLTCWSCVTKASARSAA